MNEEPPGLSVQSTFRHPLTQQEGLSDDLLMGASEIAGFLYADPALRRKVYHLVATSRLPVFRLGSVICARPSVLMKWIAEQEQRGCRGSR